MPESEASFIANSALAAMPGVINSSGPLKPRMTPTLAVSCADAAVASKAHAAVASRMRFMCEISLISPLLFRRTLGPALARVGDRIT